MKHSHQLVFLRVCFVMLCASVAQAEFAYSDVQIVHGSNADEVEVRYTELLAERLRVMSTAKVEVRSAKVDRAGMTILLGTVESFPELVEFADDMPMPIDPPASLDPGKEGFVLSSNSNKDDSQILAIGADRRGVLYAVGEILRLLVGRGEKIGIENDVWMRRAPRWPIRGLMVTQGFTIRELTGSREWTEKELQDAHLDYALAGANTFELGETGPRSHELHAFLKSYGLDTMTIISSNVGDGPPEWQAKEAIGRAGYLSPGIPEARAALLKQREALFKEMPAFDYVHFKSGDGGGDESEASAPFGRAHIELCAEYAPILRKYHPKVKIYVGNQKLDNAGDKAILEYLQAEPRDWLSGICYGPGSNAMAWTPGRRQDHRMDLFEYGGRGGAGGYLKELLHELPGDKGILLFSDFTHWVYSQYGLMDHELIPDRDHNLPPAWDSWMYDSRPDPALAMVYDRRTFHARPRNYWRVFQETSPYIIGDVAYSEGHHDHFNQWTYQRMFWEPHKDVVHFVSEYARAHFGPEAAQDMTKAIMQLEINLMFPIENNSGIDQMIEHVRKAGAAMPADLMARNSLWREYMQKALLDKYIQLDVLRQSAFYDRQLEHLRKAIEKRNVNERSAELAQEEIGEPTAEMRKLKNEADQLGKESDQLHGVRSEGFFNLKQDYHGYGWLQRELRKAAEAETEDAARVIASRIVNYEDRGPGGFYDNPGQPNGAPRMISGWAFGDGIFSDANRPSQRDMAFTTDEDRGVTFRYKDLDPNAEYRVRLTLVRPRYLPRFGKFQQQTSQSIYADETALVENLVLPEYESEFFEYDIPKFTTADGELLLWMKKQPKVGEGLASDVSIWRNTGGWGTLVSEVWLMQK